MTNIVIPVKNPSAAKQRLGDRLDAGRRRELALALFDHVLSVVWPAKDHGVLVVTDSSEIERACAGRGIPVLMEETARGETAAVESATRRSCQNGFARQLVIPGDLPCIAREDIETLLSIPDRSPSVVLCPATDDDGTNAILTTPPDVLTFRFGQNSFQDYLDQARRRNIPCDVIRLPRLVLDIDTPEDLQKFLEVPRRGAVYQLLRKWNLPARSAAHH